MSVEDLENAVTRLELLTSGLEDRLRGGSSPPDRGNLSQETPTAAFVTAFDGIVAGPFAQCRSQAADIGGNLAHQIELAESAFKALREFLMVAATKKQPADQTELQNVAKPVLEKIQAAVAYRDSKEQTSQFNLLSAVSEGVSTLGWIILPMPGNFLKEMKNATMFYTNRVLKTKDAKQAGWARSWVALLTTLEEYVKEYHQFGVSWNTEAKEQACAPPAAAAAPGAKAAALSADLSDGGDSSKKTGR